MSVVGERLEPRVLFATLPAGFSETVIASTLSRPTQMSVASDGRIFITQQYGDLRVVKDGVLKPEPVLHLDVANDVERGLIGIAADPNISQNNFIYVFYTSRGENDTAFNRVSRFTLNGDTVVPGSEKVLVSIYGVGIYHMSGGLAFGTDGMLYISSGDSSFKPNGQSLTTLKGKILRIAPDGTIPTDNPFYNTLTDELRMIWAYGVRNPFTIVTGKTSGRVIFNDVGNFSFEEVNLGQAGGNFGWANSEGPTTDPGVINPIYSYPGAPGGASAAVIGGALYEGVPQQFPSEYAGKYFFTDHIKGWIKTLDPETKEVKDFGTGLLYPTNMKLGNDGSIYYLQRHDNSNRGRLVQIKYASNGGPQTGPQITSQPMASTVGVGRPVSFFVSASGDPPMTYQWQRNGVDIPGATGQTYEIASATLADNGATFRARVSNEVGSVTSDAAMLTVTSDQAPTATILTPTTSTTYVAGESFTFSGTGIDPETGALPGSSFEWTVEFHHDTHTHPFVAPTPGASGSFTTDATGETDPDVFYRIHLTVTDPAGLQTTTFRDIVPVKKSLTLASDVAGIDVKLDGSVAAAPVVGVVGIHRDLTAPAEQTVGGVLYRFSQWSDGVLNSSRDLSFPAADTVLVARYQPVTNPGDPPPPPPPPPPDPPVGDPPIDDEPSIPPTGVILEAERAKVVGAAKIRAKLQHTGDGFVTLGGSGQGVAFQVNALKAGVNALTLRYAHGESEPVVLLVLDGAGAQIGQMTLKPTGSWSVWKTARVRVTLPAGASEVRFVQQPLDKTVHVDSLRVGRTILEAEAATVIGGASVVTNPPVPSALGLVGLHGKALRAGQTARPISLEWAVNAETAGDYTLHVCYANGSATALTVELLDVTSGATVLLVLPRTAGWSDLDYASVTLPLTAGAHKLRLVSSVQSPVVIDSLTVSPPTV